MTEDSQAGSSKRLYLHRKEAQKMSHRVITRVLPVVAALVLSGPAIAFADQGGTSHSTKPCPTHSHAGKPNGSGHGKKTGAGKGKKCG